MNSLIKKYFQLKHESHPNTLIKAEESLVDRQLGREVNWLAGNSKGYIIKRLIKLFILPKLTKKIKII